MVNITISTIKSGIITTNQSYKDKTDAINNKTKQDVKIIDDKTNASSNKTNGGGIYNQIIDAHINGNTTSVTSNGITTRCMTDV